MVFDHQKSPSDQVTCPEIFCALHMHSGFFEWTQNATTSARPDLAALIA